MLYMLSFRTVRRWISSARVPLLIALLLWSTLDVLRVRLHLQDPSVESRQSQTNKPIQRVFIASTHWNNEAILRSHWNSAVLSLSKHLGPENVFVSIVESGSWDDSKGALRELDADLGAIGVKRKLVLEDTTHADEMGKEPDGAGWVMTSRHKTELRRIPFLSRIRNFSLEPLSELAVAGKTFDKILFLNDVVFTVEDFDNLIETNEGNYAAACSLDFSKPPAFYDTFALRDSEGHEQLMMTWPYFRAKSSREAYIQGKPVPLASCWNGMVLMDAAPFYEEKHPLSFRGVPDSLALHHVEGSECCLIHVDNPLTPSKGVWLNPHVRVGYNPDAYQLVHGEAYYGWFTPLRICLKLWENRFKRWFTSPLPKDWTISARLRAWSSEGPNRVEPGGMCLVDEMQVIVANGWAHV